MLGLCISTLCFIPIELCICRINHNNRNEVLNYEIYTQCEHIVYTDKTVIFLGMSWLTMSECAYGRTESLWFVMTAYSQCSFNRKYDNMTESSYNCRFLGLEWILIASIRPVIYMYALPVIGFRQTSTYSEKQLNPDATIQNRIYL